MEGAKRMTGASRASMTLVDCARQLGAQLHMSKDFANASFAGVSTDSRTIEAGELFVAIKGETFDGHKYVRQATSRGASAALVSEKQDLPTPQIVVGDTLWAYAQLGQQWRSRFSTPIIALTGSNGKTTVKEMLRAILSAHSGQPDDVLATEGNLNNNIGVPQMLLRLDARHRYAVFEMGMNHLNEIDFLTRLVVPDVALVIMAGTAHIGELGSREAIAQAKGEIYGGLRDDGIACINLDDQYAGYWRELVGGDNKRRIVTFGTHPDADVRGVIDHQMLTLFAGGRETTLGLAVAGEHNQRNAIAAAAAAFAIGVPLDTIGAGLSRFNGVDGRLRNYKGVKSSVVIDDTYNANPDSMRAAIAVLAGNKGKRLLVLGDMGELGGDALLMHREIGRDARLAKLDGLYALGSSAIAYVEQFGAGAKHFQSVDELAAALLPAVDENTTVLVKGSRFMKMERVVEKIALDYQKDIH